MTDELSEPERQYKEAVDQRREWHEKRSARSAARKRFLAQVARESLPNVIGTVVGAGIIYLVAVASGALDGVRVVSIVLAGILVVGVLASVWAFFSIPSGMVPNDLLDIMERDALRAENERLRQQAAD